MRQDAASAKIVTLVESARPLPLECLHSVGHFSPGGLRDSRV